MLPVSRNKSPSEKSTTSASIARVALFEVHRALDSTDSDRGVELCTELSPERIVAALERSGLETVSLEPEQVPRWIEPGQVAVHIADDRVSILRHLSRRKAELSIVDGVSVTHRSLSPRRRQLTEQPGIWLGVTSSHRLDALSSHHSDVPLSPWRRLMALATIERHDISVVAAYAVTLGLLTLVTPVATQSLVNTIAFGTVLQPLVVLTIALLVGLGLAGAMATLQAYVVEIFQRRILVRTAEDLATRYPAVAAEAGDGRNLVELNNRFLDVITVQKTTSELLLVGLGLALQTIVGVILLAFYHPILLGFSALLFLGLAAVIAFGRGGTKSAIRESKSKYAIVAWLDELARIPRLFTTNQGRVLASEISAGRVADYVRARRIHFRHVLAVLVGGFTLQVISVVALLAVGGYLVIERQLTLGQLVAAEIVVGAIAVGMGKLGRLADKTFDLVAATDKLGLLLDLPLRDPGSDSLDHAKGKLSIHAQGLRVGAGSFLSPPISLDILPKQRVLIDGARGSGMTLLLETLAGAREKRSGTLSWGGRSNPRIEELAASVFLADDRALFAGTILENLRLADASLERARAWEALEQVGLAATIEDRGGLEMSIFDGGRPLSSSQRTRLILARTLIEQPDVILVDRLLDDIADDSELLSSFLGESAPWSAAVVSHDSRVRAMLDRTIAITQMISNGGEA